jgi:hypothetical protein
MEDIILKWVLWWTHESEGVVEDTMVKGVSWRS